MRGIRIYQVAAFLSDLFYWLTDIWGQMFVGRFGRRTLRTPEQLISLGGDGVRLSSPTAPQLSGIVEMSDLPSQLRRLSQKRRGRTGEFVLRLEDGRALVRRLSPIALPASRQRSAALLDLETATPFGRGDAHALTLRGRGAAGSSYAIVKRVILDPLIEACVAAGLKIDRIDIVSGAGVHCVSAGDLRLLSEGAGTPGQGWARALMLVIALSVAGTLAHVAVQYDTAIQHVEGSIGQLAEAAKAVRGAMDQRAARIAEIQALRTSVEERKLISGIWEELARVLPDSSFLTDLTVKDSDVSIAGYSAAASSIIVALEGSVLFDQASFTGPVVKAPGNIGDRFAIDLKMGGK
jgi:general secretion pathway protein L